MKLWWIFVTLETSFKNTACLLFKFQYFTYRLKIALENLLYKEAVAFLT